MDRSNEFRDYCLGLDPCIIFNTINFQQAFSPVSKQHYQVLSIIRESTKPAEAIKPRPTLKLDKRRPKPVQPALFDSSDSEVEIENHQFQAKIKNENDLLLRELEQNYELITSTTLKLFEINEMQTILTNNLDQQNEQMHDVYENSNQTVDVIAKGLEELRRNERDNKPKLWVLYFFITLSVALLILDYLST
jgi:hypothetical protein